MKAKKPQPEAGGGTPAAKKPKLAALTQSVDSVFSRLEAANASFLTTAAAASASVAAAHQVAAEPAISPSPVIASLRVDQAKLARRMERERRFHAEQAAAASRKPQGERTLVEVRSEQGHARGTSTSLEKDYLRLTSHPTLETVRPPEVLRQALDLVKRKWTDEECDYKYACDQLKSIRQARWEAEQEGQGWWWWWCVGVWDLTVQHIRTRFTVTVYEVHARIAIEVHDWAEYRQCASVLQQLYADGLRGEQAEFVAYGLLFAASHGTRLLAVEIKECSAGAPAAVVADGRFVGHALAGEEVHARQPALSPPPLPPCRAVVRAFTSTDYVGFMKLYQTAPRMAPYLMDLLIAKLRGRGYGVLLSAYLPSLPLMTLGGWLGFDNRKQAAAFVGTQGGVVAEGELDVKLSRERLKAGA
eukprot:scaffold3.g6745.t1